MTTSIVLRRATADDSQMLLRWRNDVQTIAMSLSREPVDPVDHDRWLASSLTRPARVLLIAEQEAIPVGTLRFDCQGDEAEVSLTIDPAARGKGIGAVLLSEGLAWARANLHADALTARVKVENHASQRVFEKCGFTLVSEGSPLAYRYELVMSDGLGG